MEVTEREYGFVSIENSILICVYKPHDMFDEEMADRAIEDRFKLTNNTTYPVLADIRGVKSFTPEAKELMARKGNKFISALAIMVKSPVERMIANSYMSINKPPKPTRMFTDDERAIKWLGKFVNKNK